MRSLSISGKINCEHASVDITGAVMRSSLSLFVAALLLSSGAPDVKAAELNGHILITKGIAKKRVTLPAYQLRGASLAHEPDTSGSVNEYSELVVFLEGNLSGADKPVRVELVQQNRQFEPRVLIVPVGSTVSFPNADPVFHNVFSLSNAKQFDLGYYPAGQTRTLKFDNPGVVQVYCHLHPNMYAAIVVVPNHWYARPGEDGTFSFHDVPPGAYKLVAWHMSGGFFRKTVRVTADATDVLLRIPIRDEERNQ